VLFPFCFIGPEGFFPLFEFLRFIFPCTWPLVCFAFFTLLQEVSVGVKFIIGFRFDFHNFSTFHLGRYCILLLSHAFFVFMGDPRPLHRSCLLLLFFHFCLFWAFLEQHYFKHASISYAMYIYCFVWTPLLVCPYILLLYFL